MKLLKELRQKVTIERARKGAVKKLVAQGMSKETAEYRVYLLDNESIIRAAPKGALGDGKILEALQRFIEWLTSEEGQAAIQKLIQTILMLVSLFADEEDKD